MIYLDNAATSFPKPRSVIKSTIECINKYCGNPGRSSHTLSLKAAEKIYDTREKITKLLNYDSPESVVFTYNATYALNLAIKTIIRDNCHVLTSDFEHNSVIRPLESLKEKNGITYDIFSTDGDIRSNINSKIRPDTIAIVCSIESNIGGYKIDYKTLCEIAKEHNLKLIIDASQALGHENIDYKNHRCDALCAPGHKGLFGIQGCGFVVFNSKYRNESFIEGGSGSDSEKTFMPYLLPEGYEAGTLSTPAIVSLGAGIDFIREKGVEIIHQQLEYLTEELIIRLEKIKGIKLYKKGAGIVSFNYKDIPSLKLTSELDKEEICVRGGLHCAPSAHYKMGTSDFGSVRASFSYLNTIRDVDKLYLELKRIVNA